MKNQVFTFLLLWPLIGFAKNPQILKCSIQGQERSAVLLVDSVGVAFLKFKLSDSEHSCELRVRSFRNDELAVLPSMRFDFERGDCHPTLAANVEKEIFGIVTLQVNLTDSQKPAGQVQWLRRFQPDHCKIEQFRMPELQQGAKRWQEGKWGRSTASADDIAAGAVALLMQASVNVKTLPTIARDTIQGKCTFEGGSCAGAEVELKTSAGKSISRQILASNEGFRFSGLKPGRYLIEIHYKRYQLPPTSRHVQTGSDVEVQLQNRPTFMQSP